jgi:hypothetical protein
MTSFDIAPKQYFHSYLSQNELNTHGHDKFRNDITTLIDRCDNLNINIKDINTESEILTKEEVISKSFRHEPFAYSKDTEHYLTLIKELRDLITEYTYDSKTYNIHNVLQSYIDDSKLKNKLRSHSFILLSDHTEVKDCIHRVLNNLIVYYQIHMTEFACIRKHHINKRDSDNIATYDISDGIIRGLCKPSDNLSRWTVTSLLRITLNKETKRFKVYPINSKYAKHYEQEINDTVMHDFIKILGSNIQTMFCHLVDKHETIPFLLAFFLYHCGILSMQDINAYQRQNNYILPHVGNL